MSASRRDRPAKRSKGVHKRSKHQSTEPPATRRTTFATEAAWTALLPSKLQICQPFREKEIFENQGFAAYCGYLLNKIGTKGPWVLPEEALEARISEVYRLCYEASKDINIISDFAGFHPSLALNSSWLAELVKHHTIFPIMHRGRDRDRLLRALAYGFRKAADPRPRLRRWYRANSLQAARYSQKQMQEEFSNLLKSSEWEDATEEYRNELVSRKVKELVQTSPILEPLSDRLRSHLRNRRARKASLLIAHKLFDVPIHALESKPPV